MAEYWISPTGNNTTGNGTEGNPWQTLAYAYTNSTTGDTIHFMAGTHTWVAQTMTDRTLQGASPTTTIVRGTGYTANIRWLMNNVTINDMSFTYNGINNTTNCMFGGSVTTGVSTYTLNRCILHDLVVSQQSARPDLGGGGIFGSHYSSNSTDIVTLESCLIYNIRRDTTYSLGYVFVGTGAGAGPGSVTCTNTTFCFDATGTDRLTSVIYSYNSSAIPVVTFTNCIVANLSGAAMTFYSQSLGAVPTYAVTYSDGYLITSFPAGTGNIADNPLFIDPANGNFRLRPTSPCIDAGTLI